MLEGSITTPPLSCHCTARLVLLLSDIDRFPESVIILSPFFLFKKPFFVYDSNPELELLGESLSHEVMFRKYW